ncbi:hypothetical protein PF008_g1284 [Phytophthora fragariae]|uniref:DOT1 domain-containing protein n=1 Tax=Phytophthora fragariae TaxID=53985 RepID=A0A6G0SME1_9STRA|nr:hypothetical protein PF008_g1284 [Phytophthora fragariae]
MFPTGVAAKLFQMGPLGNHDVFLNIGAGIGNVLAQVVLTAKVRKCIDVEVRDDLSPLPVQHMRRPAATYPLLRKVTMVAVDVRDALLSTQVPTSDATIRGCQI